MTTPTTDTTSAASLASRDRAHLYGDIDRITAKLTRGDLTSEEVLKALRDLKTIGEKLSESLAVTNPEIVIGEVKAEDLQKDQVFMTGFHEWFAFALSPIDIGILSEEQDEWTQLFPETLDGPWTVRALTEEDEGYEEGEEQYILVNDQDSEEDGDGWGTENDKEAEAQERNQEANRAKYGFPFSWNTGWIVSDSFWRLHSADVDAAGFLAYEYRGTTIIGIDGAGYNFEAQHFIPLYLACRTGQTVPTSAGHRRVVGKGD